MTENAVSPVKPLAFISLRLKLLVGFTVVFSVVFAGAYLWFFLIRFSSSDHGSLSFRYRARPPSSVGSRAGRSCESAADLGG